MNARRDVKPGLGIRTALVLLCGMAASLARADVLQQVDQAPEVGAILTELRDGRLFYRSHGGDETSLALKQIDYLQVTGWRPFNEAEKQQRADRHREAVRWYQRATDRPFRRVGDRMLKTDSAGDAMDYELLARCRLLPSLDKLGQWDRAVEQYLRILERMPAGLEDLRPANLPPPESDALTRALGLIDEAVERRGGDAVAVSLIEWSNTWGGRQRQLDPEPEPPAPSPEPDPPEPLPPSPIKDVSPPALPVSADPESLIAEKRYAEALAATDELIQRGDVTRLGSVYYWRGRAWHGQSLSDTSSAEEDQRRAGVAFMRVVILYPDHERAAESLFLAARIRRQAGHNEQADQLLSELLTRYPRAQPWVGQAERILSAAGDADSAPAP